MKETRKQWVITHAPVRVTIDEHLSHMIPRTFSTGACGYFWAGKLTIGDDMCQCTMSMVVVGSKAWTQHLEDQEEITPEQLYNALQTPENHPQRPQKAKKGKRPPKVEGEA